MNETADTSALNTTSLTLRPLTPEFSEEHHRVYADVIQDALTNPKIKNIALSGPYGVGKSSILESLKSSEYKDETVFISLSTLGKTSPPNNAHAPTHHIQKEIVKQLIYSSKPSDLPDSRFHRIGSSRQGLVALISILIALPVSTFVNSALATWARGIKGLQPWIPQSVCWITAIKLAIFSIVVVSIYELIQWAHSRIQVTALSAGPAKLTLANGEESTYFDRYLDEIVYFFVQSGKRIVVFEDIDRFDNTNIFEELHALNTLLNNAPQVVKRRHITRRFRSFLKPQTGIRFIYAVKDEIFSITTKGTQKDEAQISQPDSAKSEVRRANRTKFFDLIIPVVPFVTHQSARDIMTKELGEKLTAELENLADSVMHHIPDARLIRNTCNEYRVYRELLIPPQGNSLKLDPKQLFALMLYKAVHLDDFERIRLGESDLDNFYREFRSLISEASSELHKFIHSQDNLIAQKTLAQESADSFWEKLLFGLRVRLSDPSYPANIKSLSIDGNIFDVTTVDTTKFWKCWLSYENQNLVVTFETEDYYSYRQASFQFSELTQLFEIPFDSEESRKAAEHEITNNIQKARKCLTELQTLTFSDAFRGLPGDEFVSPHHDMESIAHKTLRSQLAVDLVKNGFITSDFTLYSSIFHTTHLTANAANFLLHHLRLRKEDILFQLSPNEVRQLIHEADPSHWHHPGACNIHIIHALLSGVTLNTIPEAEKYLDTIFRTLSISGNLADKISEAYLTASFDNLEDLTRWISPLSQDIFIQLFTYVDNRALKISLLNAALESADGESNYAHTPELTAFIAENFTDFPALVDKNSNTDPENTYDLIEQFQIPIDNVAPLRSEIRTFALSMGNFTLNSQNFSVIVDEAGSASLDTIIVWNEYASLRLLNDLDTYFTLLGTYSASALEDPSTDTFRFIEQYAPEPSTQLDALLSHSSQAKWRFDRLDEIDQVFWPVLAKFNRLTADASLLLQYIEKVEIDADLARFLESIEEISFSLITEQDKLEKLAIALLTSDSDLSDETRISLTKSLSLDKRLSLNSLEPRSGRFLASLLEAKLIEDDARLVPFAEPLGTNELLEVLAASENFTTYLVPGLLSEEVVCELFESKTIQDKVKQYIAKNFEIKLGSDISMKQANKIAAYANSHELKIHADDLKLLALNRASASAIIPLLEPHLLDLDIELLKEILNALPEPYPLLTTPGNRHPKIPGGSGIEALLTTLKKHSLVSCQ